MLITALITRKNKNNSTEQLMNLAETTFICTLISLAMVAFLLFIYLNKVKPSDTKKHIKQVAGSWVWMLSLLFGAYAFGELATAILIILIAIKGLHEISRLFILKSNGIKSETIQSAGIKNTLDSSNNSKLTNLTNTKDTTTYKHHQNLSIGLSLGLIASLMLMAASWLELNQLLSQHQQRSLMLFMIFVIQFNDVNQYIAGKLLGHKLFQRKLAPTISPNKTIEGAIFGTLTTAILALPIGFALTDFSPIVCFIISVAMGLCGIIGDLLQSAVKRVHGIKDMGTWIKGHGGIMDRIDSLLIAVPVFLAIYWFL